MRGDRHLGGSWALMENATAIIADCGAIAFAQVWRSVGCAIEIYSEGLRLLRSSRRCRSLGMTI